MSPIERRVASLEAHAGMADGHIPVNEIHIIGVEPGLMVPDTRATCSSGVSGAPAKARRYSAMIWPARVRRCAVRSPIIS